MKSKLLLLLLAAVASMHAAATARTENAIVVYQKDGQVAKFAFSEKPVVTYSGNDLVLTTKEKNVMEIITKVYRQQKTHFENDNPRESIPDRIVSISKPYVRPIVRGKEVKDVEFGAKCNNILVDGISFIEKLSFNAFNCK